MKKRITILLLFIVLISCFHVTDYAAVVEETHCPIHGNRLHIKYIRSHWCAYPDDLYSSYWREHFFPYATLNLGGRPCVGYDNKIPIAKVMVCPECEKFKIEFEKNINILRRGEP